MDTKDVTIKLGQLYRSKRIFSNGDNYYYSYLFIDDKNVHVFSSNPMYASSTRIIGFDDRKTIEILDAIIASTPALVYTKEDDVLEFSMLIKLTINTGEIIRITRYYIATLKGNNLKLEVRDENNEPLSYEEQFEIIEML